jgi:hypothetical protein
MVIHAITCGATVYHDSLCLTAEQSRSREVLANRGKTLPLINDELSNLSYVNEPSEALIFSILVMTTEPLDASPQTMDMDSRITHPFRLSHMQLGWERSFVGVPYDQVHHHGLYVLVGRRRGELASLQNRALAKMISNHDVLMAA